MLTLRHTYFEPPDQSEPDWGSTPYADIDNRARRLLSHRSVQEITDLLATADHLLGTYWYGLLAGQDQFTVRVSPSRVIRLAMREEIELSHRCSVPNTQWFEIFAALVIGELGRQIIYVLENFTDESGSTDLDRPRVNVATDTVTVVTEAIGIAEALHAQSGLLADQIQQKFRAKRSAAAKKGHERRRILKCRFELFWQNSEYGKKSDAARAYYRSLSEDDRRILVQSRNIENAVRTLVRHLHSVGL